MQGFESVIVKGCETIAFHLGSAPDSASHSLVSVRQRGMHLRSVCRYCTEQPVCNSLSECVNCRLRPTQKEMASPQTRTPSTQPAGCGAQCARVFPMLLGANAPWVRMVNDSGAMG